jgi:hypothetical protein
MLVNSSLRSQKGGEVVHFSALPKNVPHSLFLASEASNRGI